MEESMITSKWSICPLMDNTMHLYLVPEMAPLYGLSIFVSSTFICWSSNLNVLRGRRQSDLEEIMGGAPKMGLLPFKEEEETEEISFSPPHKDTANQKENSHQILNLCHLGNPASITLRNSYLLSESPNLQYFVIAAGVD